MTKGGVIVDPSNLSSSEFRKMKGKGVVPMLIFMVAAGGGTALSDEKMLHVRTIRDVLVNYSSADALQKIELLTKAGNAGNELFGNNVAGKILMGNLASTDDE